MPSYYRCAYCGEENAYLKEWEKDRDLPDCIFFNIYCPDCKKEDWDSVPMKWMLDIFLQEAWRQWPQLEYTIPRPRGIRTS